MNRRGFVRGGCRHFRGGRQVDQVPALTQGGRRCGCRDVIKSVFLTSAALALMASPVLAQGHIGGGGYGQIVDSETVLKREKAKEVEQDYKTAIEKIPEKKKPADPWGNVRPSTANKPNK